MNYNFNDERLAPILAQFDSNGENFTKFEALVILNCLDLKFTPVETKTALDVFHGFMKDGIDYCTALDCCINYVYNLDPKLN